MPRHIITDKERGHRKPLSPDESSKIYNIRVPLSWVKKLRDIGTVKVRKWLKGLLDETS